MYQFKNKSIINNELIVLALITGIIRKIYDEIIDEQKIYKVNSYLLQFVSVLFFILSVLLLYFDLSFMLLVIIFILSNIIHLFIHKKIGYSYDNAFDTPFLKLLCVYIFIFIFYKFMNLRKFFSNFYNILVFLFIFFIVFIEMGISFPTNQSKLILRLLFCLFVIFFIYNNPKFLLVGLFLLGYMGTSIISILYISFINKRIS